MGWETLDDGGAGEDVPAAAPAVAASAAGVRPGSSIRKVLEISGDAGTVALESPTESQHAGLRTNAKAAARRSIVANKSGGQAENAAPAAETAPSSAAGEARGGLNQMAKPDRALRERDGKVLILSPCSSLQSASSMLKRCQQTGLRP